MKRELQHPYWANEEKTQVIVQFHYEDGTRLDASVMETEEGNPDWKEIFETFTVEDIDATTNRLQEERVEAAAEKEQEIKDKAERQKTDMLFAMKLEAFEIPEIRSSKNKELKSKIRKSQTPIEIQAYTTILLQQELEALNESKQ